MEFPMYRKYSNNKSYFKVFSDKKFEELQIFGKFYKIEIFEAKILPDRNFIADLIENKNRYWINIEEDEYNEMVELCKSKQTMPGSDLIGN